MSTIRLGTGTDAVDVEDGASVPLSSGGRAWLRHRPEFPLIEFFHAGLPAVAAVSVKCGGLVGPWTIKIDLAALRRERAPKPVIIDGWTNGVFERPTIHNLYASTVLNLFRRADSALGKNYWTHRPGNTPELQAAFDAAVDAYVQAVGPIADTYKPANALVAAARALGYGSKP